MRGSPVLDLSACTEFHWQDGERLVLFGRGKLADAPATLGNGYVLLTTPRAASSAKSIVEAAAAVHEVAAGRVDELAGTLREHVSGELLVALGGGRVIDVAKAMAAADPPRRVAAIPTTLSGAEMTAVHRHASGVAPNTARVRPSLVINDPALSASQPPTQLAQSAANALGHAVEGQLTPLRNPLATMSGLAGAALIAESFGGELNQSAREKVALGALLAGYAIGSSGYGLHHVLAQSLARFAGIPHGAANAIMLPHSLGALGRRFPEQIARLRAALGRDPAALAEGLRDQGELTGLREAGASWRELDRCADEGSRRPELHMTPPAAEREELRALYAEAY